MSRKLVVLLTLAAAVGAVLALRGAGGDAAASRTAAAAPAAPVFLGERVAVVPNPRPEPEPAPEPPPVAAPAALDPAPVAAIPVPEGGPWAELLPVQRARWDEGRTVFVRTWNRPEGLGSPGFNDTSCVACHDRPVAGGAGGIASNVPEASSEDDEGSVRISGYFGGVADGRRRSRLRELADRFDAEKLAVLTIGTIQTPSLLGLGAIASIPDTEILRHEDPEDLDGDGVRGVASRVQVAGLAELGRFGWRAQLSTVEDFVRGACGAELGLTVPANGRGSGLLSDVDEVPDPEMKQEELDALVFFCTQLAPPPRGGNAGDPEVAQGELLFADVGCDACHVPALLGEEGPVPLYSDLLLHEVVRERSLDRQRREEEQLPLVPMRTPPLWGVSRTGPYLHDGRADTLLAAILAHDGEALASRDAFLALPELQREDLLAYLGDL